MPAADARDEVLDRLLAMRGAHHVGRVGELRERLGAHLRRAAAEAPVGGLAGRSGMRAVGRSSVIARTEQYRVLGVSVEEAKEPIEGDGYAVANLDGLGEGYGFRKIRSELGVTEFGVNAIVLPPGSRPAATTHERQQELYFVHSGEIEIEFGDGRVASSSGPAAWPGSTPRPCARSATTAPTTPSTCRRRRGRLRRARRHAARGRATAARGRSPARPGE